MGHIISIDQSTSGTKVLLVDQNAKVIQKKSLAHKQFYPQQGWIEHDPMEIYNNVKQLLGELPVYEVKVIALTNQRETIVAWDKLTGQPVYNAIVWQDGRTSKTCDEMRNNAELIMRKTGLTLNPYFSATKVKWLLDNIDGARTRAESGELLVGTIDSWLIWKLTAGNYHVTDYTNASRTMLFNIRTLEWDTELLDLFGINFEMMPSVKSSNGIFGYMADLDLLEHAGIPISGVIGDSQGALFGQKCFEVGMAKATYGTGTSVLVNTGEFVEGTDGLVTAIAWGLNGKITYALEGIINSSGDTIKWFMDNLQLFETHLQVEQLAISIPDNHGIYVVPAFTGLGAPYWRSDVKAAIIGMDRGSVKAHIARAALESIVYQVKDVVELISTASGISVKELNVDGGATANQFLMQFQADMLGIDINVSDVAELSAMGSVYLAGLAVGIWRSVDEIKELNSDMTHYAKLLPDDKQHQNYEGWKKAVQMVL